jgi:hypothetical protein
MASNMHTCHKSVEGSNVNHALAFTRAHLVYHLHHLQDVVLSTQITSFLEKVLVIHSGHKAHNNNRNPILLRCRTFGDKLLAYAAAWYRWSTPVTSSTQDAHVVFCEPKHDHTIGNINKHQYIAATPNAWLYQYKVDANCPA